MDRFDLSGRVALVTGSTRGIGYALAHALLESGATVVVNGRSPEPVEAARAALSRAAGGAPVPGAVFDVTDAAAVEAAVADVESSVGPLEILVNNAGLQHREPLLDISLARWKAVLEIDLTSPFIVGRAAAARMLDRGHGKVVNICSVQSELARPSIGAYTAAKGGLRNLTRAMAAEWASGGLQVNALAPGYIRTEMTQALVDDPEFSAWVTARTPAARWGTPEDLAGPLVWLASAASDFVNGQVIYVDGGMTVVV